MVENSTRIFLRLHQAITVARLFFVVVIHPREGDHDASMVLNDVDKWREEAKHR
jgi:hypothetical protein